jgi:xylulose-5-phosphate/fructose-6-phosphate phosphoketolase
MPAQEIPVANPGALPSHLPDEVLQLAAKFEKKPLPQDVQTSLRSFQRAACYIAAGTSATPPPSPFPLPD